MLGRTLVMAGCDVGISAAKFGRWVFASSEVFWNRFVASSAWVLDVFPMTEADSCQKQT